LQLGFERLRKLRGFRETVSMGRYPYGVPATADGGEHAHELNYTGLVGGAQSNRVSSFDHSCWS
jgi:hypothetical protein